jgi:hypothetical protein
MKPRMTQMNTNEKPMNAQTEKAGGFVFAVLSEIRRGPFYNPASVSICVHPWLDCFS